MIRSGAAVLLCALAAGTSARAGELPVDGVAIGTPVAALSQTLGVPTGVASTDSGHRFAFKDVAAYSDDDGIVLAVDAWAGIPRIDVDGAVRAFPIGSYSAARADAELADVAEFATPELRSYRLAPRRDLVLSFGGPANRLVRLAYGVPGQLARLGLLPGDAAARAVTYRAPRLREPLSPTAGMPGADSPGVYRVAVDRAGRVRDVDVVMTSGAPARDALQAQALAAGRYAPATLDGRPIAAAVFVESPR